MAKKNKRIIERYESEHIRNLSSHGIEVNGRGEEFRRDAILASWTPPNHKPPTPRAALAAAAKAFQKARANGLVVIDQETGMYRCKSQ